MKYKMKNILYIFNNSDPLIVFKIETQCALKLDDSFKICQIGDTLTLFQTFGVTVIRHCLGLTILGLYFQILIPDSEFSRKWL